MVSLAQQPFEQQFGVQVPTLTLSNGRYPEFFQNDSLRRIGSVVYDTRRHRIAYMISTDSLTGLSKAEVTARWLSVDPLAAKYASLSPYTYVADNPLIFIDPDGRKIILAGQVEGKSALDIYNDMRSKASPEQLADLEMMNKDDVIYYVQLGTAQNFEFNIGALTGLNTGLIFSGNEVDTQGNSVALADGIKSAPVMHLQIIYDGNITNSILADEFTEAAGLRKKRMGFYKTTTSGTFGADLYDELLSKFNAAYVISAILLQDPEYLKKYDSMLILQALKGLQKVEDLTEEQKTMLLNTKAYAPKQFEDSFGSANPSEKTTAQAGYLKAVQKGAIGKKAKYVYVDDANNLQTNSTTSGGKKSYKLGDKIPLKITPKK